MVWGFCSMYVFCKVIHVKTDNKIKANNKIVGFKWRCFEMIQTCKYVIFISSSSLCDHQGMQDTVVGMVSSSGVRPKKAKV